MSARDKCFIANVPNEVLERIFGLMPLETLVEYIGQDDGLQVARVEPQILVLGKVSRQFRCTMFGLPFWSEKTLHFDKVALGRRYEREGMQNSFRYSSMIEEAYRYFLFHPELKGRLLCKQHWLLVRADSLDLLTDLVPNFSGQTTSLCVGRASYSEQMDATFFSNLPVFPNVTELEIHISWDSSRPLDLQKLQRLFPKLKRLNIADPGGYLGSLTSLVGLEEFTLDEWYTCELGIIPSDSAPTLTRLNLIDCFEGEIEEDDEEEQPEKGWRIRELHKFPHLRHLQIDPVHVGVETLFDTATFSLQTLQVTILLRNSNFDQIFVPRPSLRSLRSLEIMVFRWYGVEGCSQTASILEGIVLQVTQLSTLEDLLLQMPFHRSWVPHFKSLEKLKVLEWRVGYFWFDEPLQPNQGVKAFDKIRSAGIDMFHRAFEKVDFKVKPKIIIKAEEYYNWEGYRVYK